MHKISVPVVVHDNHFNGKAALKELQRCNADRVFLSVGVISISNEDNQKIIDILKENIPFFKEAGLEVGVWLWTFWRSGFSAEEEKDLLMVRRSGEYRATVGTLSTSEKNLTGFCCPTSERFIAQTTDFLKNIAALKPDIIMFDDDFRYGFMDETIGCYCERHMKLMEQKLGRGFTRDELNALIYSDKPNKTRSIWLETMGESLKAFAVAVRAAVDSVDKNIRMAFCSCMSDWDIDGVDSVTLTKLLAGNTKPLMRLIGAPYWAIDKAWGNRLQHVIELERMEYAWCEGAGIEIMTEGDVYPRPRHKVPASYLECFDSALKAAGVGEYTHKYMIDYTSSPTYESGYIDRHLNNTDNYNAIERIFADKTAVGVRVYESMEKFRDADFNGIDNPEDYAHNLFFSRAARMLSDNTVPTVYSGNNGVGIAFGENARKLPAEAYDNGLIIDIRAAKILMEKGIDVGIKCIGDKHTNDMLYYPGDNEYVRSYFSNSYYVTPEEKAEAVTYSLNGEERFPDAFLYKNAKGQRFLVFAFDAAFINENRWRSYSMQKMLYSSVEWLAQKPMSAVCGGHPDLYILCKKNDDGMTVGLWNLFADEVMNPEIVLDGKYTNAEFINCSGKLSGNKIKLSGIPPFNFALINLKK